MCNRPWETTTTAPWHFDPSLSAILDESFIDAYTSEATEVQSRKGTKSAVKTTRKGRTSAEKRTNKQAGDKLSNTQSPPKDGEAGKVLGEQPTAIHLR